MTDATYTLHLMLVRMAKGAIRAWETWIRVSSSTTGALETKAGSGDPKVDAERFARQVHSASTDRVVVRQRD
jgi:hypothetical protein